MINDNYNIWFYTLSTISQTLAAILGLAAVFVVLRLQGLVKNINDYKSRAVDILRVMERYIKTFKIQQNVGKLLKDLRNFNVIYKKSDKYYEGDESMNRGITDSITKLSDRYEPYKGLNHRDFFEDTLNNLDNFVSQRDDVIKLIRLPGIIASSTIIISILNLGLTDWLTHYSTILLLLNVVLSLISILFIVRACWKIIFAIKILE